MTRGQQALRRHLAAAGLSHGELARRLGCSRAAVEALVNGRREPGLALAFAIQRACGVPAESWLEHWEPEDATNIATIVSSV